MEISTTLGQNELWIQQLWFLTRSLGIIFDFEKMVTSKIVLGVMRYTDNKILGRWNTLMWTEIRFPEDLKPRKALDRQWRSQVTSVGSGKKGMSECTGGLGGHWKTNMVKLSFTSLIWPEKGVDLLLCAGGYDHHPSMSRFPAFPNPAPHLLSLLFLNICM